jgi:penicillin-binding protein 1C
MQLDAFRKYRAYLRMPVKIIRAILIVGAGAGLLWFALCLPQPLFDAPYSPAMYDRNGGFLNARVAADEQWRFPPAETLSPKFAAALIEYEDKRFQSHWGVDVIAIGRAAVQNGKARRIVSGASTITMQTVRMMRRGKTRTIFKKAAEAVLAIRLELGRSKAEILGLYAANAPFGGNVVGIAAAAWRWFGHSAEELSWAEAAVLAVLPNAPSLIHPGRNRELLQKKRNDLLTRLRRKGHLDEQTLALAMAEALPEEPHPLPQTAPHLFEYILREKDSFTAPIETTIDGMIQSRAAAIIQRRSEHFAEQGILNAGCLILDTASGEVLAYIGNARSPSAEYVDVIQAKRSSGSILKPFLFAAMLDAGELMPSELVSDIPTRIDSYKPENNAQTYTGIIPAGDALTRSLNVPAVRALRTYGVSRFVSLLQSLGVSTLFRSADEYGLPLILGGAEVTLWDLCGLYAGLARTAMSGDRDASSRFFPPSYVKAQVKTDRIQRKPPISPGAAWLTLNTLTETLRPDEEASWKNFGGSYTIAWKTGTSFGFRDAWAIGVTSRWTVGVWIGNATGEGRAELRAANTAAPVLFELFSFLEPSPWMPKPYAVLKSVEICSRSGFPAGANCETLSYQDIPIDAPRRIPCPFCKTIVLNELQTRQVRLSSASAERVVQRAWFIPPPAEEWYYRRWNLDYKPPPPFEGQTDNPITPLALFNPEENARLYIPIELDGGLGKIVFAAAHREQGGLIYWHLDDAYLGYTNLFHELEYRPAPGPHTLTIMDASGNMIVRSFTVLNRAD